jgi:predicted MFS family arabinose efflux permease
MTARRAMYAVYAVFILNGFAFASWASRIPQVRDGLELNPQKLGLVLLAIAIGSLVSMPLAGVVISRIGAARTVSVMSLIGAAGLAIAAIGYKAGVAPVVPGLFLLGLGSGTWDVAMNVEGAEVERRLGSSIMSRFHAGFSVGTVAGALLGSAMIALGVSVTVHLVAVAVLIAAGATPAVRGFLPVEQHDEHHAGGERRSPLKAWTEPRTLLIGLFVFTMAFTEGTGVDWLGIAMIDGYDVAPALGSLTFAVFLAAMTLGRWFGPGLLDRHGRVALIRATGVTAVLGLVMVVYSGSFAAAMAGAALWGVGVALGFPVGMSAAADDPRHAAGRVSVVSSIGYLAFLAGPPFVGFLGHEVGTLRALTAAAALVSLGVLLSGVLRPRVADRVEGRASYSTSSG